MILVKLQGGLGNQMFQYAAAKGLAAEKELVFLDYAALEKNNIDTPYFTARKYELGIFDNLQFGQSSPFLTNLCTSRSLLFKGLRKIVKTAVIKDTADGNPGFGKQPTSTYYYLDGFFQSENYFKNIKSQLFAEFSFPALNGRSEMMKNNIISTNNAVGIHVRRGDYLKPAVAAFHGILPLSYYQQARDKIESFITNPHYFVFSDDPEWCKNNFSFLRNAVTFVALDSPDKWEDMYLMSLCKHNIIANSSYSWWAAWLNANVEKVTISPKNWFINTNKVNHIVPQNWIQL
jgi:hypothetical protein